MLGSIFDKNKSLSSYLFLVLFLIIIALFFIEIFQQDKNDVNDVSIFNSEDSATKIQDMNFTNATQVFFISQNLFDNNKINQSEVYALFSLKLNPNLTQTHNLLFDIYLRKNEHVEAKLYLLNAYKLDPNKVRTKVDFGKLLIAQNKYDDAIEVFKKIINEHPNDPYAFNYLGYAYYFLNDYENAKKYFNISLNIVNDGGEDPYHFACPYEGLGMVYFQNNDDPNSKKFLSKSIHFRPGITNDKYKFLAQIYIDEGNYTYAKEIVDKWTSFDYCNQEATAQGAVIDSLIFHKKGEYDKAILKLDEVYRKIEHNEFTFGMLAKAYYQINQYEKSIRLYESALSLNSDNDKYLSGIGYVYDELDILNESLRYFEESLRFNPKNDDALAGIGWYHLKKKNYSFAQKYFLKSINLNPKNKMAHLGLGKIFFESDFKNSQAHFKYILSLNPYERRAYDYLISLYLDHGEIELAKNKVQSDMFQDSEYIIYKVHDAMIHAEEGKYELALKKLRKVVKVTKDFDPILYSEIGYIYYLMEDYENARLYYEKSILLLDGLQTKHYTFACPYEGLGLVFYKTNNMEASKKNLIEAHKFNPYVSKKSYEILAQIYKSQNDFEELNKINIILESNFK